MRQLRRWGWVASLLIATAALWWSLRGIDGAAAVDALTNAQPIWIIAAFVTNLLILVFWAGMWRAFLPATEPVRRRILIEVVALTSMSMNVIPWLIGQASGVVLLTRIARLRPQVAMSVVATETVAEAILKIAILLMAIAVAPLPAAFRTAGVTAGITAGVIALLLFAVARLRHRFTRDLQALRSLRRFLPGLIFLLACKLAEAAAIVLTQRAFGVQLPIESVVLIVAAIQLATMVSVTPGNVGVYEAATMAVYHQLGVDPAIAFPIAVTHHTLLLLALVGPGYLMLIARAAVRTHAGKVAHAVIIWAYLVLFSILLGVFALLRNFDRRGSGRHWRGMRDDTA